MKNRAISILIICMALGLFLQNQVIVYADSTSIVPKLSSERIKEINSDFRGLWVATVLNLDYPSKPTSDSETLKNEATKILDNAQAIGINVIVLQVKPSADAFYKSNIFPWSKYLTGKQGLEPSNSFDPLKYWIDEAHKRGIAIHAWINPYRITKKLATEKSFDYSQLSITHPAILHPEWVVEHADGNLYFNPGLPEVQKLIVDSVLEIVKNYDVDGIHFDDYFYPSTTFNDTETYVKYGSKFTNINDWRRNNVNQLINDVQTAIKTTRPEVRFGISPFGIWANSKSISSGSDTNGYESYFSQYADSKKWVEENMIDYIAPQIYWNIGYSVADYSKLLNWWQKIAQDSKVDLYIGHAAYRVGNSDKNSAWYKADEIERQLSLNDNSSVVKGSIFFRYAFFNSNFDLRSTVTTHYAIKDSKPLQNLLIIGRPSRDSSTTAANYYIGGASDIRYPLYINGKEITDRTSQGYYGVYVPLMKGINSFIIKQNGQSVMRKITRIGTNYARPMSRAEIISGSEWPQSTSMTTQNEFVTFSCKAPIGAAVKVTIAGKTYIMTPSQRTSSSQSIYATTYSAKTTLPVQTGNARIVDFGNPVYSMIFKGKTYSLKASANVKIAMEGAPYVATISEDYVDSYLEPTTTNGGHFILLRGMTDYVTGINGNFVRLSSGLWVKSENVKLSNKKINTNKISSAIYSKDIKYDTIDFKMSTNIISAVEYNGKSLKLYFEQTAYAPEIKLPLGSMVKSIVLKSEKNRMVYELVLNSSSELGGYMLDNTKDGLRLKLNKKFVSNTSDLPLKGLFVMIDPGHGGTDSGAVGLLGDLKTEKHVVSEYSNLLKSKLEALGAMVLLTRDKDIYVSLNDRLMLSRTFQPDLFISFHADSLSDTSDITKVNGFSVFYKDQLAKEFALKVKNNVVNKLYRKDRGANVMNFYVIRGTWAPSILIETGFMPNPSEFQWLNDKNEQSKLTDNIMNSIVEYFTEN